jgi:antitoxin HigA-1
MSDFSKPDPKRAPVHPGRILREYAVPALKLSKVEIAAHLGISRQTLHDLLAEKQPITPQMAVRIGKLLGNGPNLWLARAAQHGCVENSDVQIKAAKDRGIGEEGDGRNALNVISDRR